MVSTPMYSNRNLLNFGRSCETKDQQSSLGPDDSHKNSKADSEHTNMLHQKFVEVGNCLWDDEISCTFDDDAMKYSIACRIRKW